MSSKTALVMRATGSQGRGTVKHLLTAGWKANCVVSNASSDRAVSLKELGPDITLFECEWENPSTIEAALKGCSALFLNTMPSLVDDAEVKEAEVFLKLAEDAGVTHVVYPSTLPLSHPNVQEHMKDLASGTTTFNKGHIEEMVKGCDMGWTILRPGWFMTNYLPPLVFFMFPEMKEGKLVEYVGHDDFYCLIDPEDTGSFAAAAFENPGRFSGQTIDLVAQKMRAHDIARVLERVMEQPLELVYKTATADEKTGNGVIAGHLQNIGLDKFVNMESIASWGVQLTTFEEFVERHKEGFKGLLMSRT